MLIIRISKILMVAAMGFFATLVAFGNITDFGSNWAFVHHVMEMDTLFPDTTITYRAISSPGIQLAAYILIILAESLTAILCWVGAYRLLRHLKADAKTFHKRKCIAIAGLTLGFLIWQVGFMSVGGEWFGMWMSDSWNGVPDAFRFFITIIAVLIYLVLPESELDA